MADFAADEHGRAASTEPGPTETPRGVIACLVPKLAPGQWLRRPVLALAAVGSALAALAGAFGLGPEVFGWAVAAILLVMVLAGLLAEAVAEARLRSQAAALRRARQNLMVLRLGGGRNFATGERIGEQRVPVAELHIGNLVVVSAGELIPTDGVIEYGMATVNEAAVTGESAPVLRESGTERCNVVGGTKVLTGEIVVRVTAEPGHDFVDRMVAWIEASRQKTRGEIALEKLLTTGVLILVVPVATLAAIIALSGFPVEPLLLLALLLCLLPTTIASLLPLAAIGGMSRALAAHMLAKSVDAVALAGEVDLLMFDKTGAITHGSRQASAFHGVSGVDVQLLREVALLASLADPTPQGKSIVRLAHQQGAAIVDPDNAEFHEFSAGVCMTGVDLNGGKRVLRIGKLDPIRSHVEELGGEVPLEVFVRVERLARGGAAPLVVSEGRYVLGVVELSQVVRHGIKKRLARLRAIGIRSIMFTGDDPLVAAAIAAEAGVDDYVIVGRDMAQEKIKHVRAAQAAGHRVATAGSGIEDAPVLAQADFGLAMNSGAVVTKETGNMIDLDSDPASLLMVPELGRIQRATCEALAAFAAGCDLAKCFVVLTAVFAVMPPPLAAFNVLALSGPYNAVLAVLVFSVLVIPALPVPALRGLRHAASATTESLHRHRRWYGIAGAFVSLAAIKLIDLALAAFGIF